MIKLSVNFALYESIKKDIFIRPALSFTADVALLLPLALGDLPPSRGNSVGQTVRLGDVIAALLMPVMTGPPTALPLILFSCGC